jgi:outer membrane receptor protein involved in Fe transport
MSKHQVVRRADRAPSIKTMLFAGVAVLASLPGSAAWAAEAAAAAPDDSASSAQAGGPASGEIVVTARQRNERLQDVPVAVTAITSAQVRQYGLTSVANIKILAPQISFDRGFTGAGASVSMRGVSSSSLDAGLEQSILVDMDGMPISRGRVFSDALFDLESVDVLKGPQSLFFGKNSPGGVVSLKSAGPTRSFEGYVRGGYEFTARAASVEAAISGPLTDTLGYRVAMIASHSDGYIHNQDQGGVVDLVRSAATGSTFVPAAASRLGAERRIAGRLTLKYSGDSGFDATFKMLVSRYTGQGLQSFSEVMGCPPSRTQPGTVGGVIDPNGDCKLNNRSSQGWLSPTIIAAWPQVRKYADGKPYSHNYSFLPTLTLSKDVGGVTLTSVTGYYDYDYVSQGNADATSYSYFWSYSNEKNKSIYQEVRAVSSFDGIINFATGGHFEHNNRDLYVGGANGPVLLDPATGRYNSYDNIQSNKSTAYSVFGQLILKPFQGLEIAGGARYTHEQKKLDSRNTYVNPNAVGFKPQGTHITGTNTESNVSPEATITYHPTRDVMVYGAYKTGYLSGGFSNPGTLSAVTTNLTLSYDAEKARGFEVGTKFSAFDHRLSGSLIGYRYIYKGLPLTSLVALSATSVTFLTQNAASTITKGVEAEASYRIGALTLRGSATYNDAHFESFPGAQCYTGQTAALGCLSNAPLPGTSQDLSGRVLYRAPHWLFTAGGVYQFDLSDSLKMNINADIRTSSSYYTSLNLNPTSRQKGYMALNAGFRISTSDDKLSFAVIGRNLTNRIYGTIGVDKPGGAGETFTVAGEPRAVVLQVETRF